MSRCLHIVETKGIPFTMRLVEKGEAYGLNMCLTHDKDDPLVEFYDRRFPGDDEPTHGTRLGQFVSRYYLSTLLEPNRDDLSAFDRGLCLDGGVPDWTLDASAMRSCRHALMGAGVIPAPEGRAAGWLRILEESPMIGVDPHPSWAPTDACEIEWTSDRLSDWSDVYGLMSSLLDAEQAIMEEAQVMRDEVIFGNLADEGPAELATPVFVTSEGAIEFLEFATGEIYRIHSAAEIYDRGFGMVPPVTGPTCENLYP